MASSTYLTLTNNLLEDFNEPTISSSNFSDARSVTRVAKNAINRSIDIIQTDQFFWPFNKASGSQILTTGTNLYSWPSDYKVADMNSFYISADNSLGVSHTNLYLITMEEWMKRYRKDDYDNSTTGLCVPNYVFHAHNGWGIARNPDKAYTVNFDYFTFHTKLSNFDDTSTIPQEWDHVIYLNAYPFMNKFYENDAEYQLSKVEAKSSLKSMRTLLINDEFKVYINQMKRRGWVTNV